MNKLVAIGFMGDFQVYLNVSKDMAIRRYAARFELDETEVAECYDIREVEFSDEFCVYDVWEAK